MVASSFCFSNQTQTFHKTHSLAEAGWSVYVTVILATFGLDHGFAPDRAHAVVRSNAGLLLIGPLEINSGEIIIKIRQFHTSNVIEKASVKWQSFYLGLRVLNGVTSKLKKIL